MTHSLAPHPTRMRSILGAFALLLTACSVNPATGERDFTAFMSPEEELRIRQEQHPKIIAQFGGVYDVPDVTAYVDRIGQSLAKTSELPNVKFTFTVLNDDIVNAFALPGGYVYISRGLLGLANTEAELAGVLGHEIGHVTARHSAQRYSSSVVAQGPSVGASILGSLILGTPEVGQAVGQGSAVYLQSFSREHEFEADTLGVRYLARAGYATDAMASFLASLQAFSSLEAKVSGRPDPAARSNIMSTHPRTQDRVVAATRAANVRPVRDPKVGNLAYMKAIDGIIFGGSLDQGLIRGQTFVHELLNFRFDVPQGYRLQNGAQQVVAQGPNNAVVLFSAGKAPKRAKMASYLTSVWAKNTQLSGVQTLRINGMEAARRTTIVKNKSGTANAQLVAIRHSANQVYRFVFLTPTAQTAGLQAGLTDTMMSFRKLTRADRNRYGPWKIDTKVVRRSDSVARLAGNTPLPAPKDEWFRVLNGLQPGSAPFPGQTVKVVTGQ